MMCSRVATGHNVSIREGISLCFFTIVVTYAFHHVSVVASSGIQHEFARKDTQCNLNSRRKSKVFRGYMGYKCSL